MGLFEDWFWSHADRASEGCWEWTGARGSRMGYGNVKLPGHYGPTGAHRVAYMLTNGSIPDGYCVCHACNNPPCFRPDHLYLATSQQNLADGRRDGLYPHGSGHYRSKVSAGDVRSIRERWAAGQSLASLGREYGVKTQTIFDIVRGKSWKHLPLTHRTA